MKFEGCYHGAGGPVPGQGGERGRDARAAGLSGRARGAGGADAHRCPSTTSPRPGALFARQRERDRRGHRRAGGRQHGRARAPARASSRGWRRSAAQHGALLIFDEVMTGFRLAQGRRAGAVRGHAGPHHHGEGDRRRAARWGPTAAAARPDGDGRAGGAGLPGGHALRESAGRGGGAGLPARRSASRASTRGSRASPGRLRTGSLAEARAARVPVTLNRVGSMWTAVLHRGPSLRLPERQAARTRRSSGRFFHALLDRGVYLPPVASSRPRSSRLPMGSARSSTRSPRPATPSRRCSPARCPPRGARHLVTGHLVTDTSLPPGTAAGTPVILRCCASSPPVLHARRFFGRRTQRRGRERAQRPGPRGARGCAVHQRGLAGGRGRAGGWRRGMVHRRQAPQLAVGVIVGLFLGMGVGFYAMIRGLSAMNKR